MAAEKKQPETFSSFVKGVSKGVPPQEQAPYVRVANAIDDFRRQLSDSLEYPVPEELKKEIQNFLDIL